MTATYVVLDEQGRRQELRGYILEVRGEGHEVVTLAKPDRPLKEDLVFLAVDRVMHRIWTWSVAKPGYREDGIKKLWQDLEGAISRLARSGER